MGGPGTRRSDRGAALLLVVIFMAGALLVTATLLARSQHHLESEAERHRLRSLHAVLLAGAGAALNEVNRDRHEGPYDPGGDGVGALGIPDGVELRAPDGRSLGRYRTTVRRDQDGRVVLVATAAHPDFRADRRLVIGAEFELSLGWLEFGDRPFEVIGRASGSERRPASLERRLRLRNARLLVADPSFSVPAMNISDPVFHQGWSAAIQEELEEGDAVVVGGSIRGGGSGNGDGVGNGVGNGNGLGNLDGFGNSNGFGHGNGFSNGNGVGHGNGVGNGGAPTPASGQDTIGNEPAVQRLNVDSLRAVSLGLIDFVDRTIPQALELADAATRLGADHTQSGGDGESHLGKQGRPVVALPEGTYYLDGDLKLDEGFTLIGAGTLIVNRKLSLNRGAAIEWDGDIVVAGSEENSAELRLEHGAALDVNGVLAVEGSRKKANLKLDGGRREEGTTTLRVQGALLLLTDALTEDDEDRGDDKGEVRLKRGAELQVDGAFVIVGEHLHVKIEDEARLAVNGAMTILVPGDARKGLHKFHVKSGADVQVLYDRTNVDGAVEAMARLATAAFGRDRIPLSARLSAYVERPGPTLVLEQEAAIHVGAVGLEAP